MKYLLDTHVFLWWVMQSSRLSPKAFALCRDESNVLLLSLVSVWEIQIKQQSGKLRLAAPLDQVIQTQRIRNKIELFPIELNHILQIGTLPDHHKDPFDRLLVAQVQVEDLILISADPSVAKYPIKIAW